MIINNNEASNASRLNLDQTNLDQTSASSRTAEAVSAQPAGVNTSPGGDSISLSSSNLVQQALSAGASTRSARVQQLKALIQNNQYQPDALEVSRALISAHIAGD
jgi:anti-sigma28 factor (negative regulator of flagellin synthesis)